MMNRPFKRGFQFNLRPYRLSSIVGYFDLTPFSFALLNPKKGIKAIKDLKVAFGLVIEPKIVNRILEVVSVGWCIDSG